MPVRTIKFSLKYANEAKLGQLNQLYSSKAVDGLVVGKDLELDEKALQLEESRGGLFDYWVYLKGAGKNGSNLKLPIKSYYHANKFFDNWRLKKGGIISKTSKGWFLKLTFSREDKFLDSDRVVNFPDVLRNIALTGEGKVFSENCENLLRVNTDSSRQKVKERVHYLCNVLIDESAYVGYESLESLKTALTSFLKGGAQIEMIYGLERIRRKCREIGIQIGTFKELRPLISPYYRLAEPQTTAPLPLKGSLGLRKSL